MRFQIVDYSLVDDHELEKVEGAVEKYEREDCH
jgi:hypothetical protein